MRRLATAATGLALLTQAAGARAQPPAPSAAAAAATRCPRTIRSGGPASAVTLAQHACATLRLGGGLLWSTPRSSNRHVRVARAAGAGAWYLTGASPGTATITAVGRPNCGAGQACPAFIVAFRLQVRVVARARRAAGVPE